MPNPKKPCKKCVPDPRTSYAGLNGVIDVYRCERCGKTVKVKPW